MRLFLHGLGCLALCSLASAQINDFQGPPPSYNFSLDFDTPPVATGPIASTDAAFTTHGIASCVLTGSWGIGGDTISAGANSNGASLCATGGGPGVLTVGVAGSPLSTPLSFGGFIITLQSPATLFGALFVDQNNFFYTVELFNGATSLGSGTFQYTGAAFPIPPRYWTGPGQFDKIKITFAGPNSGVGIDEFLFDSIYAGTPYCTAKTNSLSCLPVIAGTGTASATAASGHVVSVTQVINNKPGLFIYTNLGPASAPLSGGLRCVATPLKRSVALNSGGNPPPNDCSGTYAMDFNAFRAGSLGGGSGNCARGEHRADVGDRRYAVGYSLRPGHRSESPRRGDRDVRLRGAIDACAGCAAGGYLRS